MHCSGMLVREYLLEEDLRNDSYDLAFGYRGKDLSHVLIWSLSISSKTEFVETSAFQPIFANVSKVV